MTNNELIELGSRLLAKRYTNVNCWEWDGPLDNDGYGKIKVKGKYVGTHRLAFQVFRADEFNSELSVLHACDNRKCFNPDHLFQGTQLDNVRDCIRKGRFRGATATHCLNGHRLEGDNLYVTPKGHKRCRQCARVYYTRHDRKRRT